MAKVIQLKHSATGLTKDGFYGFSWTTLFFGPFVPLFRGDFLTFVGYLTVVLLIGLITAGIGGFFCFFIWSFFYNGYYTKKLIEKGYKLYGSKQEIYSAAAALGIDSKNVADVEVDIHQLSDLYYTGERSLTSAVYQSYLVEKFNIVKNEKLEKYILNDNLFKNLDEALICADELDKQVEVRVKEDPLEAEGTYRAFSYKKYASGRVVLVHSAGRRIDFETSKAASDYLGVNI